MRLDPPSVLLGLIFALAVMALVDAAGHWIDELIHREWED